MIDFDTFLDALRATLISGALPTLNLPKIFHQGSCIFSDVSLVSNYDSYKENKIKLLPYHSFYGGHIPPRKNELPFLAVRLKKNAKPPECPFRSTTLKNFKLSLS